MYRTYRIPLYHVKTHENFLNQCTGLFVIIATGLAYLGLESDSNLEGFFEGSATGPGAYALAFYAAVWAYGGGCWQNIRT